MDQPQPVIMQQPGMAMQNPGMAMEQPGMAMQQPGMAMQQPGMAMQQPGMAMQQPGLHTTNIVVLSQQQQQFRQWNTGLCGCFEDLGSCCMGLWCPSCLLIDVSQRLGEGCCFPCCCPNATTALRGKLRTEQRIQGSLCNDYCITCWCPLLVCCQMSRELQSLGR